MDTTMCPAKAKRRVTLLVPLLLQLLVMTAPAHAAHPYGLSKYWNQSDEELPDPKFEDTPTEITALVGQTVFLPCNVAHLGDKVVSWIRTRDLHILTSHLHTFTSDSRFSVLHKADSSAWNLRILGAKPTDEGRYECQVNTDPKMMLAVFLHIRGNDWLHDRPYGPPDSDDGAWNGVVATPTLVRHARLLGAAEVFVSTGSTVTFTCLVDAPYPRGHPPHAVMWLHRGRVVSIQAERGGISLQTLTTDAQTTSRLTVALVSVADAGNYTCAPGSGVTPAVVSLVVTDAERTEAMQRDGPISGASPSASQDLRRAALLCLLLLPVKIVWMAT